MRAAATPGHRTCAAGRSDPPCVPVPVPGPASPSQPSIVTAGPRAGMAADRPAGARCCCHQGRGAAPQPTRAAPSHILALGRRQRPPSQPDCRQHPRRGQHLSLGPQRLAPSLLQLRPTSTQGSVAVAVVRDDLLPAALGRAPTAAQLFSDAMPAAAGATAAPGAAEGGAAVCPAESLQAALSTISQGAGGGFETTGETSALCAHDFTNPAGLMMSHWPGASGEALGHTRHRQTADCSL